MNAYFKQTFSTNHIDNDAVSRRKRAHRRESRIEQHVTGKIAPITVYAKGHVSNQQQTYTLGDSTTKQTILTVSGRQFVTIVLLINRTLLREIIYGNTVNT